MLAALAIPNAARAVGEPTRNSTPDGSVMQIDEPRFLGNRLVDGTLLVDADGKEFPVGDIRGKPAILLFSYYDCDGSCPTMNAELVKAVAGVSRFQLGKDYNVLTVSFDRRDTVETARKFAEKIGLMAGKDAGRGWRHAIVKSGDVERFAGEVGFRFFWSDAASSFMHPNVAVFLTPTGRVARYLYGTRLDARAVELALIDADWERIANSTAVFDMLTGACFSYNYAEGRYQLNYSLLAGVGSLVLGLSSMLFGAWMYRRRMARKTQGEMHA